MNDDLSNTKEMKFYKKIGVCLLVVTIIMYLFLVVQLFKNQ
jgi:hypothetical protein